MQIVPHKMNTKRTLALLWRLLTLNNTLTCFWGTRLPILCYHSVHDEDLAELSPLQTDLFSQHIEYLSKHHSVVPLEQLITGLQQPASLPANPVAITFDDGYSDNYQSVFPIISELNVPITVFLATDYIDQKIDFFPNSSWHSLSWAQIQTMQASNLVKFAPHSTSHQIMSTLSDQALIHEISNSLSRIHEKTGDALPIFAYPNGQGSDFDKRAINILIQQHYQAACSTFWCSRNSTKSLYALNRIRIDRHDTVAVLKRKLAGDYDYIYLIHRIKALIYRLSHHAGYIK